MVGSRSSTMLASGVPSRDQRGRPRCRRRGERRERGVGDGKCQETAEITWNGSIARGSGLTSGESGAIRDLPVSLASRMGEPQGKTSPEELIAAAHAGCFAMALGSVLAGRETPPERLHVTATVTLEMTTGAPAIVSSELDVQGVVPGSDEAAFEAAAHEAEHNCVVSRALEGNVEIKAHATLEAPSISRAA